MDYEYGYRQVDKEHLSEFLGLYRSLPLLWDTQDKDYYNKFKKTKAYKTLLTKYQEKFPHATENDVKKRLNALRTNFRKELRKVVRYLKMGEVYQPKLWYFNELSFLRGLRRPPGAGPPRDDSSEQNIEDGDATEDFEQASTVSITTQGTKNNLHLPDYLTTSSLGTRPFALQLIKDLN